MVIGSKAPLPHNPEQNEPTRRPRKLPPRERHRRHQRFRDGSAEWRIVVSVRLIVQICNSQDREFCEGIANLHCGNLPCLLASCRGSDSVAVKPRSRFCSAAFSPTHECMPIVQQEPLKDEAVRLNSGSGPDKRSEEDETSYPRPWVCGSQLNRSKYTASYGQVGKRTCRREHCQVGPPYRP